MKHVMIALAAAAATLTAAPALAAEAAVAAAPAAALNTTDTSIGDLLDNPAAKAVLAKHIPAMIENAQIDMARSMTLKQIQGFAGDTLTDEVLAKIDVDLAALKK
jgi:hypothetical protein